MLAPASYIRGMHRRSLSIVLFAIALAACRAPVRVASAPLVLPAAFADTVHTTAVAPGARLHRLVNTTAPWRTFVLEVDLTCSTLRALKGSRTAVGRTTTSQLLASVPADRGAIAAINADFFLFAPPGVPTNLHVEDGVLLAGPGPKPVVYATAARVHIDSVTVAGRVSMGATDVGVQLWNRPAPGRVGLVDARWGVPLDTTVRKLVWRLEPAGAATKRTAGSPSGLDGRYVVRARRAGDTLVFGDTLLLHQPARGNTATLALHDGDTVHVQLGLAVRQQLVGITDAVGGRPIVLADSVITPDVDAEGNEGFRNLNPRSAIGFDRAGTRAWLAVIDGRQPGVSMGMTLRQVGALMQALGATRALNLDGGGSSALALRDPQSGAVSVVNSPSDKTERPVGNALGVLSTCRNR